MNTLAVFDYEATHGMQMIIDIHHAVAAAKHNCDSDPVAAVAHRAGRRVEEIKRFLNVHAKLRHRSIQTAATTARLSLSVVLDVAHAVFPLRNHNNRDQLVAQLCSMLEGLTADQARALMTEKVQQWAGDSTKRPDTACMHKRIGKDGKRRLTAAFSTPVAARIDTILHRLAERIKQDDPKLQYDQAYAQALIRKLTSSGDDSEGLFGPMFMIPTTCHFHNDGTITTTDGAHVNILEVVNEKIADAGWAAVTGTTDDSPVIPLVTGLVKVHRRFATPPQRLAAIIENLVCAWPSCDIPASKCQIHHIKAHKHGGQTTGVNLAPLCKKHNGMNDDNPGQHVNGRIEKDPHTGRPGLKMRPDGPLIFNNHPLANKTITALHKPKP